MSAPPTLREDAPLPGLWPVVVGAVMFLGSCPTAQVGGSWSITVLAAALLAWGVHRRWIRPRQARRAEEAERAHPERLARLDQLRDGTWFASVEDLDEWLSMPCTWYSPTPSGQIREKDRGTVTLSRDGVRLSGAARAVQLPYKRLVRVEAKRDGVILERSNGPHIIVAVEDPEHLALAFAAVNGH